MSDTDYWNNLEQLPTTVAHDIVNSSQSLKGINAEYIAANTTEITYESMYNGPDTLTLTIIDPDWKLLCSSLCDVTGEGIFQPVDINFPNGTDCWWRLSMVDNQGGDLTTPNTQLTFQHRLVKYLQADWGHLKIKAGSTTRAQFIKQLADRIPANVPKPALGPGSQRSQEIQFICPELNIKQDTASPTGTSTKADKSNADARANGTGGIGYGANLQVKGGHITRAMIDVANIGLRAAESHNASEVVMVAMIYAGMGESTLGTDPDTYGGVSVGVWQAQPPHYDGGHDTAAMAEAWLTGGTDFQSGGGIAAAHTYPDAWQIANAVEANAVWNSTKQDSYASYFPGGQAGGIAQAKAIVAAFGGSSGATGTAGSSSSTVTSSDISQLARGGQTNPDEDSWSCMTRLAQEVNWELFTSARAAEGQWGNFLYYRTGPNNAGRMPSAYIVRSDENPGTWDLKASTSKTVMTSTNCLLSAPTFTVDDSAFQYVTTKAKHGKNQKAVRHFVPQTPTQIQIEVVSAPFDYNAGEVIVFENSGPINGRWIVTENDRNIIADDFNQITLGPPTMPNPEPVITTTVSSSSTGNAVNGSLAKVVELAKAAATLESQKHCYTWTDQGGRTNDGHGVLSPPYTFDCSGFSDACYKYAGLPDPSGGGYAGSSYAIQAHCQHISQAQAVPGDLCCFDNPGHVCIWIGGGNVVNMGGANEPYITALQNEIDSHGTFYGFYHLAGAK